MRVKVYSMVVLNSLFIAAVLVAMKNIDLAVNICNLASFYDTGISRITQPMTNYYLASLLFLYLSVAWLLISNIILLFWF